MLTSYYARLRCIYDRSLETAMRRLRTFINLVFHGMLLDDHSGTAEAVRLRGC